MVLIYESLQNFAASIIPGHDCQEYSCTEEVTTELTHPWIQPLLFSNAVLEWRGQKIKHKM